MGRQYILSYHWKNLFDTETKNISKNKNICNIAPFAAVAPWWMGLIISEIIADNLFSVYDGARRAGQRDRERAEEMIARRDPGGGGGGATERGGEAMDHFQ